MLEVYKLHKKSKIRVPVDKIDYLQNQEKAMAHKRAVMQRFKKVIFAPITLTTNLASNTMKLFTSHLKKASVTGSVGAVNEVVIVDATDISTEVDAIPTEVVVASVSLDDEEMSTLLSLDLCVRLLHANKESLGRALVITYAVDNHRT